MDQENPTKQRVHITFGKFGVLKYTSNLDIAKVWERVLRRAKLPIVYSRGFNTHPRMQLATALPLGITSECELLDVSLRQKIDLDGLAERILAVSPDGLEVYDVEDVPVTNPPLQTLVRSAKYRVEFADAIDPNRLQQRIDDLLAQDRIIKVRMRKRRKDVTDLRPLINDLYLDENQNLVADLATGNQGNVRLEDIIEALNMQDVHYNAHRYELHIEDYP